MALSSSELYKISSEGSYINPTIRNINGVIYFVAYNTYFKRISIRSVIDEGTNINRMPETDLTVDFLNTYKDPYFYLGIMNETFLDVSGFLDCDYFFIDDNTILVAYVKNSRITLALYDIAGNFISSHLLGTSTGMPSIEYSTKLSTLYVYYCGTSTNSIKYVYSINDGVDWTSETTVIPVGNSILSLDCTISELDGVETGFLSYRDNVSIKIYLHPLE